MGSGGHDKAEADAPFLPAVSPPECHDLGSSCLACNGVAFRLLFETGDRLHGLPGTFRMFQCQSCGLVRLSPQPTSEQLAAHYPPSDYYSFKAPSIEQILSSDRGGPATLAKRSLGRVTLRFLGYGRSTPCLPAARLTERCFGSKAAFGYVGIPPARPSARMLDVGCGAGTYLALLRSLGWDVMGVEASRDAAEIAARSYGIDVRVGDLSELDLPVAGFDHIRISHTLEHMSDPVSSLKAIRESLSTYGSVYIETPNAIAFNARRMGSYWIAWDPPRHLNVFSPASLRLILRASGLQVQRLTTIPHSKVFRFETAYREEEAGRRPSLQRDEVDLRTLLRAARLRARRVLDRKNAALSGDNLAVWAVRQPPVRNAS